MRTGHHWLTLTMGGSLPRQIQFRDLRPLLAVERR